VRKSTGLESGEQLFAVLREWRPGWRQSRIEELEQGVRRKPDTFWMRQRKSVLQPIALVTGVGHAIANRLLPKRLPQLEESSEYDLFGIVGHRGGRPFGRRVYGKRTGTT
jgi:hypothetical protein